MQLGGLDLLNEFDYWTRHIWNSEFNSYIYRIETALNFVWPVAKTFPPNKFVLATELLDSQPLNFVWPVAKTFPPNKFVLATELLDSQH
jgi:hypothetical protein